MLPLDISQWISTTGKGKYITCPAGRHCPYAFLLRNAHSELPSGYCALRAKTRVSEVGACPGLPAHTAALRARTHRAARLCAPR